jgi:ferredoxin
MQIPCSEGCIGGGGMNIIIDGKICMAERGEFILDVARRNGINIPTLCHSDALPGQGICRLCMVEVIGRGRAKIAASCIFPLEEEVEVVTNSEKIRGMRKTIISLLLARSPHDEVLQRLGEEYGMLDIKRSSMDKEEEFASGRVLESRFYDACKKLFGNTNAVKASLQDDILAGTDYFLFGFRVDITFRDKSEHAVAKDIYYCENNGLQCTANILDRNKHSMYPAPVLSLRFSGNTEGFQPLYHLIKEHMTPMLLEFNKVCHMLNLSF